MREWEKKADQEKGMDLTWQWGKEKRERESRNDSSREGERERESEREKKREAEKEGTRENMLGNLMWLGIVGDLI